MKDRIEVELENDIVFLEEVLATMEQELKGKVGLHLEGELIPIEGFPPNVGYVETNPLDIAYWRIFRVKNSLKQILERRLPDDGRGYPE